MSTGAAIQRLFRLDVESSKAVRGLQQTSRAAKSASRGFAGLDKNLIRIAAGFASFQGIKSIANSVRVFVDEVDKISRTAEAIGIGTEALQKLHRAAEQAGSSTGSLDTSMARFTRNVGDARLGKGVGVEIFERLGVAITDANGRSRNSFEVFKDLAKIMRENGNEAEVAADAMRLFGRDGQNVINLIKSDLAASFKETEELGLISPEAHLKNLALIRDAYKDWDRGMGTLRTTILDRLTPAILFVFEKMHEFRQEVQSNDTAIKAFVGSILYTAYAFRAVAGYVSLGLKAIKGLATALVAIGAEIGKPFEFLGVQLSHFASYIKNLDKQFGLTMDKAMRYTEFFAKANAAVAKAAIGNVGDLLNLGKEWDKLQEGVGKYNDQIDKLSEQNEDHKAKFTAEFTWDDMEASKIVDMIVADLTDEAVNLNENLSEWRQVIMDALFPSEKEVEEKAEKTSKIMYKTVTETIPYVATLGEEIKQHIVDQADAAAQAFVDLSTKGISAFGDLTKSILNDIAAMIIKAQVVIPLLRAIGLGGFIDNPLGGRTVDVSTQVPVGTTPPITGRGIAGAAGLGAGVAFAGFGVSGGGGGGMNGALNTTLAAINRSSGSQVNINVENTNGSEVTVEESQGTNNETNIRLVIENTVNNGLARGAFDNTMNQSYGARRRGQGG